MKAAAELQKANDIKFVCVDLTKEAKLSKQFPISRVPTLTLFKAGKAVGSYEKPWIVSE
jgi:thioredoxin-like negative regulator of GroEL